MKKSSAVFIFAVFIFCFSLICGAIPIQQCPRPQATMDEYFDEAKSENKLVAFVCCEKSNPETNSEAFKKSVGLNGVGIKAVNALSESFEIQSFRDGET